MANDAGKAAQAIIDMVGPVTRSLSDPEYLECLDEVMDYLETLIQAKKGEMGAE